MKEYDFYVLETEDGEIYICETFKIAKDLSSWYSNEYDGMAGSIKGGNWEISIA